MRGRLFEHYYMGKNMIMDSTNMKIVPAIMGTEVRLTTSMGLRFTDPATMTVTAATGDTARSRLPARPMGTLMARTLIPAAAARGTMRGTMAKTERCRCR